MAPTARPLCRRVLAGLAPVLLALGAIPLLAPTCGGGAEGNKTFARSSLVIPMDRCYQSQTDGVTGTQAPAGCPQAADPGDVIKAYGLVYQLIRNDVAVYWVIDQGKTSVTGEDFHVQYDAGAPVLRYDWNGGPPSGAPTANHVIHYMGGPFVVDGSDYAKASAVLQRYKATFSGVKVHVSNVAFSAYVKKTMAGGWNAGGTVSPKLALLDIGSGNLTKTSPITISDPKNAEPVIEGYLAKAGIGSGAAGGTAIGPHGEIYDRLGIDDFQPATGSTDPATSRLFANGYQILWVPHWVAPGSCSDFSSAASCATSIYPQAKIDQVLRTIGAFVASGRDVFAECAGLGSFEGAYKHGVATANATDYTLDYQDGDPATRFQTTNGVRYNELPDVNSSLNGTQLPAGQVLGSYSSPLLQIGDYPFVPYTGAVEDFRPQNATAGGAYLSGVTRLIAGTKDTSSPEKKTAWGDSFDVWDYFTLRPSVSGGRGTVVYLGGHSYSGVQGTFQIAGSRLVLNTLFNLGAGCTETGVSCNTGELGVCAQGRLTCDPVTQAPVCQHVTGPSAELCDGLDNDCNGLVDEGLEESCYGGPAGTKDVGLCRSGVRSCQRHTDGTYAMSACTGEVRPAPEVCNGLDDDCDGKVDRDASGALLSQSCYYGPLSSLDPATGLPRGICQAGAQACVNGSWGGCDGQVLPAPAETCQEGSSTNGLDDNCDGRIDEGCSCTLGATRKCYSGPPGTAGVGLCKLGDQVCDASGSWGPCAGEVVPAAEICGDGLDQSCNGMGDDGPPICAKCVAGDTQACYSGPAGTAGVGVCHAGTSACVNGDFASACDGEVLPASGDPCDGLDNDCDGEIDEDAACGAGLHCEVGVCVPSACGPEQPCPEGYDCTAGTCTRGRCNGATCDAGKKCQYGTCVNPCGDVKCGAGDVCASGGCTGGSCYFSGCPDAGQLCLGGKCVVDPCHDVVCPGGTFCRQGDCVQACTFVSCFEGEKCGADGFCVPDACAGKSCAPGQRCVDGSCATDACADRDCGAGQVCVAGTCVDDPCSGVKCPAGACLGGQCFSTENPTGAGTIARDAGGAGGCGCGSGGGSALLAILGVLAAPLARRRRAGARGGGVPLVLLALAVALSATACRKEPPFDPSKCEQTCEEQRCVDVATDPSHCGACGAACAPTETCVDGTCGPAQAVAPWVAAVSPGAGAVGALEPVAVEVSGERFAAGATVRTVSAYGTRTFPAEVLDAKRLRVELDLSQALPATWQLRVVNPDRVISNAVAFDVVRPTPVITGVSPPSVKAGTTAPVTVTGTGFSAASQCHLAGGRLNELALATSTSAGALVCTVDARDLAPGAYDLWVVNDGGLASGKAPLAIVSDTPVVTAVSPSSGATNDVLAVTVTGSGFDPTSAVVFGGVAVGTLFVDPAQLYVPQLSLAGVTSDTTIAVRNGSGVASAPLVFHVGARQATVSGLSPGTGYQGDTVTLTFTGSDFPAGTTLEAAPPSGAFAALGAATCSGTCTATTCVCGSLAIGAQPEGAWLVRLSYPPDASKSAAWSFRVLSNQAILRDATPRGGVVGTTVAATLTAGNLRPDYAAIRVLFGPAGGAQASLVPSPVPSGTTVQVSIPLAGRETGTYTLQIVNPAGAAPSNAISFNVTPGKPTLSSVAPAFAIQGDALVDVTLTGTNFARPDASGNGGSIVHIAAPELGIADEAIAAADTTVVSATQLKVRLDTRTGLPGKYDVSVWNPSAPLTLPPVPQKSDPLLDAFEIRTGP